MSVVLIRLRPPSYFTHVPIATPVVSALKNYYIQSFLGVYFKPLLGVLNHFWVQVAVSLLQPPHGGFRCKTAVAFMSHEKKL